MLKQEQEILVEEQRRIEEAVSLVVEEIHIVFTKLSQLSSLNCAFQPSSSSSPSSSDIVIILLCVEVLKSFVFFFFQEEERRLLEEARRKRDFG
jgi:hypothetical protein